MKILFRKKKIDFTKDLFYTAKLYQFDYDREIDEGFASNMSRYVTLDITDITEKEAIKLARMLKKKYSDFDLCSVVQINGLNKPSGKKYLIISGINHHLYSYDIKSLIVDFCSELTKNTKVKLINEHITVPGIIKTFELLIQGKSKGDK